MAHRTKALASALLLTLTPAVAVADGAMVFGGDTYASGKTTTLDQPSPRSAFVSGVSATLDGPVAKDAHLAGGHVSVDAPVTGDLYAAGAWVVINGSIGGDVSAAGYSVSMNGNATVGGNVRIAANEIKMDATVSGSLLAAAQDITINSEISGDVMLTAEEITFGPNAKINGTLKYLSPSAVEIPASVIAPDRVMHKRLTRAALATLARMTIAGDALQNMGESGSIGDAATTAAKTAATKEALSIAENQLHGNDRAVKGLTAGLAVTLIFLVIITALFLAYMPQRTEQVRAHLIARPFSSLGIGFIAFSALVGAIPVAAVTIIGLPLIPFFMLAIPVAWVVAYALASYSLSWQVVTVIKPIAPSMTNRLLATAAGIVVLSLTHFLWFFGWIINLVVVLIGLGAIAATCAKGMIDRRVSKNFSDDRQSAATLATTAGPATSEPASTETDGADQNPPFEKTDDTPPKTP